MTHRTQPCGFLLLNKPSGPTSHDLVNYLRKITGIKKIGHAGTLDPLASGLLIMAIGRPATRRIDYLVKQDKVYQATIHLNGTSDTDDRLGLVSPQKIKKQPTLMAVQTALTDLTGNIEQIPPMYSAKKIAGKKLYELARQGQVIERPANPITIHQIKILNYQWPQLQITIHCSSGTYIRSIARDLGDKLSCGGYLAELSRTKIGQHSINQAVDPQQLNKDNWTNYLITIQP